jgi:transposase
MARVSKYNHPEWALAHRKPGVELRFIGNKYYLYSCSGVYDKSTKKSKKVTGKILGTITEKGGFIESDKRKIATTALKAQSIDSTSIMVKEFGFTSFLNKYNDIIIEKLKLNFPEHYQIIIYMAYCRFLYASPIKNFAFYLSKSMISNDDKTIYTDKKFSSALREIGLNRASISNYLKSFMVSNDHVMVDMTNVFCASNNMRHAKEGYNSDMIFDKQFNLLYIYSPSLLQPVFYKLLAGNIKDVTGFKMCLKESGITDAVIIADKGFYSKDNIAFLESEELKFIIPLKRDNAMIDYTKLDKKTNGYFKYQERYIWYFECEIDKKQMFLFKDEKLQQQEQKDYLDRIVSLPEEYTIEKFKARLDIFGTIAILTNAPNQNANQIYTTYKSRNSIEVMFDGYKNIIKADKTYMQNEDALEGYLFVSHIALQWYYIIYNMLKEHNQTSKYSVMDFATHLKEIKQVKINDSWHIEPIIKASQAILKKMKISIT